MQLFLKVHLNYILLQWNIIRNIYNDILKLQTYSIYSPHQNLELRRNYWVYPAGDFLCVGPLADYLLVRLHGIVVWEYNTIFNTKHFIINSKITALYSRNRSAVLTYIYINTHTQVAAYWRVKMTDTHPYPRLISHTQTHYISEHVSLKHYHEPLYYIHTQVAVYRRFAWWLQTHTYTHAWLLPQTHISLSRLQEHFPNPHAAFHATCVLISPGWDESS